MDTNDFPGDIFWYNESLPVLRTTTSAFESFNYNNNNIIHHHHHHRSSNVNKRVIEFLRRSTIAATNINIINNSNNNNNLIEVEHEKERCFRHMMNERMRRDKQKQSYFALHSVLPLGTKNDKNSIVQTAATKIRQLESCRERLRQRKIELETVLAGRNNIDIIETKWTKVTVRINNPTSGVDSMLEVLNCLKKFGLKAKNIRSVFTQEEFLAELEIETKVEAAEIEEAIQLTLYEAELKLLSHF